MITNNVLQDVLTIARQRSAELVATRRHIHKHPELSFQEFETAAFVRSKLEEFDIPYAVCSPTGTIATIGFGTRCVGLRADIDALPISEATGLDCASVHDGKMHACGHDAHTAMLLGAAKILKEREASLPGIVKLFFQPGEEKSPGGAKVMIEHGALEAPTPEVMFAQHCDPEGVVGEIALVDGPVMAANDELFWTVSGVSSHAAQPHKGSDTIPASAALIQAVQTLVSREKDPFAPGVISITTINGGTATNVVPDMVKLSGTMRSMSEEWRAYIHKRLQEVTAGIASTYGVSIELEFVHGYPVLSNDRQVTDFTREIATTIVGERAVKAFEPKMWAEDFAFFAQQVPSCYWMLGVRPPSQSQMFGLHHPEFSPSEDALPIGTAMLVASAMTWLSST